MDREVTVTLSAEAAQHALKAVHLRRAEALARARTSAKEPVKQASYTQADRLYEASIALSFVLGEQVTS